MHDAAAARRLRRADFGAGRFGAGADPNLQRELGVSYLFITYNIGVVEYIADRIVVMKSGRVEEQGACAEVLANPTSDYTRQLLAAVPRLQLA